MLDVVLLVDYVFLGGPQPTCSSAGSPFSSGSASVGLSSSTTLSDGTKRVYLNGSLNIPALGFELDLSYDSALVKIKGTYKTLRTQGLDLYVKDDLKGHAKIGLLKQDGSSWIDSGSGSLLELQFTGSLSSVRLTAAVSADTEALKITTTITQATVPVTTLKTKILKPAR